MVSPFQIVAEKLGELGVYSFLLPWLITAAVIWGLLKKSKLFGEDTVVMNSVISISISFFIWGFLIFTGSDLGRALSSFFTQMAIIGIVFTVILVVGSIFFPDFTTALKDKIPGNAMIWIVISIGIVIAITAGLMDLGGIIFNLVKSFTKIPGGDVGLLVVAMIVLLLLIMLLAGGT